MRTYMHMLNLGLSVHCPGPTRVGQATWMVVGELILAVIHTPPVRLVTTHTCTQHKKTLLPRLIYQANKTQRDEKTLRVWKKRVFPLRDACTTKDNKKRMIHSAIFFVQDLSSEWTQGVLCCAGVRGSDI